MNITTTNGELLGGATSATFPVSNRVGWREAALLMGLGVGAVLLHVALRGRLELAPGHQGFFWIALLLTGRMTSRYHWAAALSSIGAAGTAMMPVWGFGDPFRWLTYLLAGLTVDLVYTTAYRWQSTVWFLAILGGLAHMTKPLVRVFINAVTGWPYGSILLGVAYPAFTHFVFGAAGALLAAGAISIYKRRSPA
jgi:hypothetical protein